MLHPHAVGAPLARPIHVHREVGVDVVGMQAVSPETVSMKGSIPESARGCCKVVALTEGNDGEFFVTLKRVAPLHYYKCTSCPCSESRAGGVRGEGPNRSWPSGLSAGTSHS